MRRQEEEDGDDEKTHRENAKERRTVALLGDHLPVKANNVVPPQSRQLGQQLDSKHTHTHIKKEAVREEGRGASHQEGREDEIEEKRRSGWRGREGGREIRVERERERERQRVSE